MTGETDQTLQKLHLVQASNLGSMQGRLPLDIIKVSRHGNDLEMQRVCSSPA